MRLLPARLRSWLGGESATPYCPDFSNSAAEHLAGSDGQALSSIQGAKGDSHSHAKPLFFANPETLKAVAERVAVIQPKWQSRLFERVRSDCEMGLPIYGQLSGCLGEAFPWDLRSNESGEDILYAVRPHRFAFMPRLALAILYGAPLEQTLAATLRNWMRIASTGHSRLPYLTNLVVIQRFIALSWTWAFLAARSSVKAHDSDLIHRVLKILRADARFLMPRLGDSYPNNHLLLDAFAGWYIGLLFPDFVEDAGWLDCYEALWLRELARQTYEDGTGFEHSSHYQEYACEMTAAYVLLSRRNSRSVPDWVTSRLEQMLAFQIEITPLKAAPLAIGNGTEDPLFPLDIEEGGGGASFRELYRALFDSNLPASPMDNPVIERAFWLLGGEFAPSPAQSAQDQTFKSYPVGGFFAFSEPDVETKLIFRTGPIADKPVMGGHMHADLLSIYANVASNPIVIDAGTYTYRAQLACKSPNTPQWRAYFAGPEAHNGLSIRNADPLSVLEQDFRNQKVEARVPTRCLIADSVGAWVEAEIESQNIYGGYRRGVVHVPGAYWLIYDQLPMAISTEVAIFSLQLAPGAKINMETAYGLRMAVGDVSLGMTLSENLRVSQILNGSVEPLGGWVSRRYGELEPALQIRMNGSRGDSRLTAFLLEPNSKAVGGGSLQVVRCGGGLAFQMRCGQRVDYLFLGSKSISSEVESWGIRFKGAWLWLRTIAGVPTKLRWLEGQSVQCEAMGLSLQAPGKTRMLELQHTGTALETRHGSSDGLSICWPDRGHAC